MIIFTDLSEVFIQGMWGMKAILRQRFGESLEKKFWDRHLETESELLELFRGKITEDEYWEFFMAGVDWPEGITVRVFKNALSAAIAKRVPGTLGVLERMRAYPSPDGEPISGVPKIYVVSDHIKERIPEILQEHVEFFEKTNAQYWSCCIGMIKGDEGFWPYILKEVGVKPQEVLYIDDMTSNIIAARKAGIENVITFQNSSQLELALEAQGFYFS